MSSLSVGKLYSEADVDSYNSMSPAQLLQLYQTTNVLVLAHCPSNLNLGLDYNMWRVGPKFLGVKFIPPGPHYLYWSLGQDDTAQSFYDEGDDPCSRSGMFLFLRPQEVEVLQWDPKVEQFVSVDEDQQARFADAARQMELDQNLGPYPQERRQQWEELSRMISEGVFNRVQRKSPASHQREYSITSENLPVTSVKLPVTSENFPEAADSVKSSSTSVPLEPNDESIHFYCDTLRFCEIPKLKVPPNITPADLTRLHHDKSETLFQLLKSQFSHAPSELLGDLQMAYIAFLLGQNYDAFEHWKHIVILLSHCEAAVEQLPKFFGEFLRVLHGQLCQAPDELFLGAILRRGLDDDNFVLQCIRNVWDIMSDARFPAYLPTRARALKNLMEVKLRMSLEDLEAMYSLAEPLC